MRWHISWYLPYHPRHILESNWHSLPIYPSRFLPSTGWLYLPARPKTPRLNRNKYQDLILNILCVISFPHSLTICRKVLFQIWIIQLPCMQSRNSPSVRFFSWQEQPICTCIFWGYCRGSYRDVGASQLTVSYETVIKHLFEMKQFDG